MDAGNTGSIKPKGRRKPVSKAFVISHMASVECF